MACTRFLPVLLVLLLAGCRSDRGRNAWPGQPLDLASFTENEVRVEIRLEREPGGRDVLSATFTPLEAGCHLYSKDLPSGGVDGLGRPTLLEVLPGSGLSPAGVLEESVPALLDEAGPGLLAYPSGPVRLSLPVLLPEGRGWSQAVLAVTYMACSEGRCTPPTIGRQVEVSVPGREQP